MKKQEMCVNLSQLDYYNKKDDGKLANLTVNELKSFDEYNEYLEYKTNMDNIYMLTPQLFHIFKDIKLVHLNTFGCKKDNIFSMSELLVLIEGTRVEKIEIAPDS